MGVVYKITDNIKEFIIEKKKQEPDLSCRSLVAAINKKFKVTLSKSSVNSIFKQAGLSQPVGRRPRPKPKPKPEPKKIESFSPAAPLLLKQKSIDLIEQKPAEKKEQPKEPEKPPKQPVLQPIVIKEDKKETPILKQAEMAQPIDIKEDEIIDNLGFFFLKAAEWQVSKASILSEAIKPYLPSYEAQELEIKSQALLYLAALGILDSAAIKAYDKKDIWVINLNDKKYSSESLCKFVEDFKAIRPLSLAVLSSANRAFSEVNFFKITLADNTLLYVDGQFKSVWPDSTIPELFSIMLNNSISYSKQFFQSNVQSINIFTVPGYLAFSPAFYEFVYACEDLPQKRMVWLSSHSQHKDEISPPAKLPTIKHYFTIGFWPWQEEGKRFIQEDIRIVKSFFSKDFGKEIFYSEMKVNLPQYKYYQGVRIRAALLRDTGLSWPRMGLLTNLPDDKPMEEIISNYLERWPNQDEAYQDFLKKSEKAGYSQYKPVKQAKGAIPTEEVYTLSSNRMDLWQNLTYLVNNLSSFSQRYFFPIEYEKADFSTMKQEFYSLPGQIKRQNQSLFVSLIPPSAYAFSKELLYAVRRVNESDIHDPLGRKLWLKIK